MSAAGSTLVVARKNLVIERRMGEALLVTAPVGAVALWVTPMGVGTDVPLLREVGPGMYWVVILLFGSLITLRQSVTDQAEASRALALAGVPAAARLLGAAAASFVLLLAFELMLAPVVVILFDPALRGWPWVLPMLPAMAAGIALLGAVAQGLLQPTGVRITLGPLLTVPLSVPLLLAATQSLEAAALGRSPALWLLLAVIVDLILVLAVLFVGRMMEDSL
jgi:heme exporter protein B